MPVMRFIYSPMWKILFLVFRAHNVFLMGVQLEIELGVEITLKLIVGLL